jgi:4-hydroxy-2-oxoheptanedioate aldolase
MSEGRSIPVVRLPGHDHASIAYAMDAGASIIVPQVNTVEEAKHIVAGAKFGTKFRGARSAPPFRLVPGITDTCYDESKTIHENWNEQAAIIIQIESLEGIKNLDAILTEVPEIDCVWLGPLDVRVSMGLQGFGVDGADEEEWIAAQKIYYDTIAKHNKPSSGLALGSPQRRQEMGKGKCFVISCTDVSSLMGTLGELAEARQMYPALGQ